VAEQKFLNSFFHFERHERVAEDIEQGETPDDEEADGFPKVKKSHEEAEDVISGTETGPQYLLNQLFAALLPEIEDFIDFGDRHDS
jgi:hypothetical protein